MSSRDPGREEKGKGVYNAVLLQGVLWIVLGLCQAVSAADVKPDFDGNGAVDFEDFLQFVQAFGETADSPGWDARFDLDGDGSVGFGDFTALATRFGTRYVALSDGSSVSLGADPDVRLEAPAGALAEPIEISVLAQAGPRGGVEPPEFEAVSDGFFQIGAADSLFQQSVALTIPYTESRVSGAGQEEDVVAAFWDGMAWVEVEGRVDTEANTVRVETSRLAGDWALRVRAQPSEPPNLVDKEIGVFTPARTRHQMILVPEGEFIMGTDTGAPHEGPVHTVFLDAYRIDKVEVSYAHYVAFLNAAGRTTDGEGNEMIALGLSGVLQIQQTAEGTFELTSSQVGNHPIFDVSWYGAKAYCEWMGGRLPTEAEWEKAARGTDGRTYPWGNGEPNASILNFDAIVGGTTPVGRYPGGKSPYGVLDMAGNVWEWVQDRFSSRYYSESPKRNPQGPDTGNVQIIRGGSWDDIAMAMRSSLRFTVGPTYADPDLGFRCARRP